MIRRLQAVVLLTIAIFGLGWWWFQRPQSTLESFVGHLSHARYAEASAMLESPSDLEADSTGGLRIRTRGGETVEVAAEQLPFLIYGNEVTEADRTLSELVSGRARFSMLASGTVLTLQAHGGSVGIERIDML